MSEQDKKDNSTELPLSPVAERLKKLGLPVKQVPPDNKVRVRIKLSPPAPLKKPASSTQKPDSNPS